MASASNPLKRLREDDPPVSHPRKRPGSSARISPSGTELIKKRQQEREAQHSIAHNRSLQESNRQHYNAVPQFGREYRSTESKIKGLRKFNNWVKSTLIHKFSPSPEEERQQEKLKVLDIGCGKGGDLEKWARAPQAVGYYVGIDPAEVSINQAAGRHRQLRSGGGKRAYPAEFLVDDAFANALDHHPQIRQVGFGPGSRKDRGFDVVSMMFCMHYAFENEIKAKGMLANVAQSLRKGGRFIGVIPNSDVISSEVVKFYERQAEKATQYPANSKTKATATVDSEPSSDTQPSPEWGSSIYRVRFPGTMLTPTPKDGIFRPPYGWKYSYFMEEAVEEVPEYVVPWEAFRAIAEDFNLELQYRKPFRDIWEEDGNSREFGPLSERMGVRERDGGKLMVSDEEMEACSFYHAFCFYKV